MSPANVRSRVGTLVFLVTSVLAVLVASAATEQGKPPPGVPAPRHVVFELQQELTHATGRLQAMDEAGVLSHLSDRYRSDSFTKAAVREQLRLLFSLYDTLRPSVQIDEVRTVGEEAWVYSTGEVSGRLRGVGVWMPVLSWKHEREVARREQGVWRLYGNQQ
ncbi:MAG TPA: hypothetical protein VE482_05975 [Candidatus Eisenbacteria bacterium]|nr:hypothetical protein [Candidatus Eisenbacteria bacterium]